MPYTVKSGVSMAANLRQAFKESELLQRGYQKVRVYNSPRQEPNGSLGGMP